MIENTKRVLLIDNDDRVTRTVRMMLERRGCYLVREENDPVKAVSAVREFQPDLIVLDVAMPGKDGGAIAAELRQDETLGHIPIVFFTSMATPMEAQSYNPEGGGHSILDKGMPINLVIGRIEHMLHAQPKIAHLSLLHVSPVSPIRLLRSEPRVGPLPAKSRRTANSEGNRHPRLDARGCQFLFYGLRQDAPAG